MPTRVFIDNFVHPDDAVSLMKFFDENDHLCDDGRAFHKDRNIHFNNIPDPQIRNLLNYYAHKNIMFIDHHFVTKTKQWQSMRMCRWLEGHFMPLHVDRQLENNDTMVILPWFILMIIILEGNCFLKTRMVQRKCLK